MRSLGTRRAALVAGAATVAALALSGCSAGQVAETAILDTPIAGVNTQSKSGSVLIRNLQVEYNGTEGYAAQENAPLELSLYNQTNEAVTVTISVAEPTRPQVIAAANVGFVSTATVTTPGEVTSSAPVAPSGAPSAGVPAQPGAGAPAEPGVTVEAARIQIGPQGSALFRPTDTKVLQVIGLKEKLTPGLSVALKFAFSDSAEELEVQAPVASPLTPAPRGSAEIHEQTETEGGGH
ncbi:hypothetical protein [Actinoplanes utahensis]|uniref:Lipoprotein n=1 Tax=Actinoplanes utahensis TaxID=1869 RepID=A0A0A6UAD7_ACTUT|nr:hypothetical protein [Actinoplanes utahensis]KHD72446.1 hypothetical protein MB27_38950 [Actinoplanes utahensis]GIF29456.1 hypothetical protein Aut01nite_24420 [Actinoplanes utahensis]